MEFGLHIILHIFMCIIWRVSVSANGEDGGDLQALLSFKAHIVDDPLRVLASWNNASSSSSQFCNNWRGVSCSLSHQRVAALDLSGFQLRGTLSASIGNLTFLQVLQLSNNSFSGSIPQEISQLKHLRSLRLSNNSLTGEIPRNLSYLPEMIVIDLDRNRLTGMIPVEIGSMPHLMQLDFSNNLISGTIPSSFGNLSALTKLSLSDNFLTGVIPQELGKLRNLTDIDLSQNLLTGAFPMLLHNITTLRDIQLDLNNFNGSVPSDFGLYLPNLITFSVQANQFTGHIPASITNASVLEIFDISFNQFSGQVPMDLGHISLLQRLGVSNNLFSSNKRDGLKFITSLSNCTNLKFLDISSNNLQGMLPSTIANLSNKLVTLRLDENYIYGGFPDGLENLKSLGRLNFSHNNLTGTIPDNIGKVTSLQELYLGNNMFTGGIPSSIGNLSLLSILEMRGNMFSGGIPASLSKCTKLLDLDLSSNMLTEAIPMPIFSLTSLTSLRFQHNILTGLLPVEVGRMTMLTLFDISDNILSGELPSSLGSCISMETFNAQSNLFTGSIPKSLAQIKFIQLLDLSNNELAGRIPAEFTLFASIQFLDLSSNHLEGQVPDQGLFRNSTAFSIAGNENLCGGIKSLHLPQCPSEQKRKLRFSLVMVLPAVVVVAFMLIAYTCVFYHRSRTSRSLSIREPMNSPLGEQYPKLSYAQLLQATDRFSSDNLIGTGRYSWVYKGILTQSEQCIAIKVLKLDQRGSRRSFLAECEALKNIRHRNLVKIITACSGIDFQGNEFKALVYEFMSNGNLDSWLHPTTFESTGLDLSQRLSISIDVASVLVYLHHGCEIPILHRDIKPSNVLLDDDFCAHLGDFGSARSLLNPIDRTSGGRIHPTICFHDAEYAVGAPASTLVDVYSYGILLLEMFTGRRPTDTMFKDDFSLHNYVKMALPDKVTSIADPRLLAECENNPFRNNSEIEKGLASVFRVGVVCSFCFSSRQLLPSLIPSQTPSSTYIAQFSNRTNCFQIGTITLPKSVY